MDIEEAQGGDIIGHEEGAGARAVAEREDIPFPEGAVVDDGSKALTAIRPGQGAEVDDPDAGDGTDGRAIEEEPSLEAASPTGDDEPGEELDYEIDPEDPETWPEETRRAVGQYKSRLDLANALIEGRRSFKTELDRRLAEKTGTGKQPADGTAREERAAETREPAQVVLPEEARQLETQMAALADAFDRGVPAYNELSKEVPLLEQKIGHLKAAVAYLEQEIAAETDEADKDRLMERKAKAERELERTESTHELKSSRFERLVDRMTRMQNEWKDTQAKVGSYKERAQAAEARRHEDAEAEESAIQGHESRIVEEIKHTLAEFKVPEAKRQRFSQKLIRAATSHMDSTGEDIADLRGFFAQEAREELADWGFARQEQAVTLGAQKRRDATVQAPRAVAKPDSTGRAPRNRQEADRLAAQGARRIQYQ